MSVVTPLIELQRVSKTFGHTRALVDVSFELLPGEVHVIAGANGAGKSTLIKILSGAISDFAGVLQVGGRPARLRSPDEATRAGIATIHQELSLVASMSVADNLFLGARRPLWAVERPGQRAAEARRVLSAMGLELAPDVLLESLPLATRQQLEIARALTRDARVLIMDEPTSALTERDAERLFERVQRLKAEGKGIVFITHRLEEIYRLADRITVLCDGKRVLTAEASELTEADLVRAMVGRAVERLGQEPTARTTRPLLEVRALRLDDPRGGRRLLDSPRFTLHRGEVLGVAGLSGSGTSELLHAIFGALPAQSEMLLEGARFAPHAPADAIAAGVVLSAGDRRASVLPEMSVLANATLSSLRRFAPGGWLRSAAERAAVSAVTSRLSLVAPSLDAPAGRLSGGNQQKVALGRCLLAEPKVLLLDDPTRGIDVAAKADVHALIRNLASRGAGVLIAASELDELLELSDRVLVLFRGKSAAVLERSELDRRRVMAVAMGGEAA